jgi:hypothetical protein
MIIQLTGLPRSGTAWCSTLLNLNPDCVAYHELAAWDPNWRETLRSAKTPFVADCSTTGYLHGAVIEEARKVAVIRDADHCFASSRRIRPDLTKEDFDQLVDQHAFHCTYFISGDVWFEDLFTVAGATKLWRICFERNPSREEALKIKELVRLRIQNAHPEEWLAIPADVLKQRLCA